MGSRIQVSFCPRGASVLESIGQQCPNKEDILPYWCVELVKLHVDRRSMLLTHSLGSASQLSLEAQNELPSVPKEDVFVRGAINPRVDLSTTPLSITTSIPAHPKPATPQRTISYRQRMRKIATNEITLDDVDAAAMAKLGLSLFMVDQDMIANQNRFVRNECAFAHHILRLQRTTSDADAHHTQIERDIYKHLEHHKSTLDALARMCGPTTSPSSLTAPHSARHDPDFLELEKSHQETRAILEALSMQVSESSQSTQRALMDLVKRLDQIVRTGATYPNAITRSPTAITPLSPLISSSSTSRTWGSSRDSILESPRTIPPPTPEFPNHPWHRPQ